MKQRAIVDRFEGEFIILECDDGKYIKINRANAPAMVGEGMVVWYEDGRILSIDEAETARQEYDLQKRFERLLGRRNLM